MIRSTMFAFAAGTALVASPGSVMSPATVNGPAQAEGPTTLTLTEASMTTDLTSGSGRPLQRRSAAASLGVAVGAAATTMRYQ